VYLRFHLAQGTVVSTCALVCTAQGLRSLDRPALGTGPGDSARAMVQWWLGQWCSWEAARAMVARAMVLRSWEVAASFKPPMEILEVLALHMGAHRIIACVSKDWAQAAEFSKNDLVEKFLNGTFDARCLHTFRSMACPFHSTDIYSHMFLESQLSRAVRLSVGEHHHLNDLQLWWYRTQLHLSLSIFSAGLDGKSFKDILRECFEYSEFKGYGFSILERQYREWSENVQPNLLFRFVPEEVFTKSRYVSTRDMGCEMLGRSIKEVLLTLICALRGIKYRRYCGCSLCDGWTVVRLCGCRYSGCRICNDDGLEPLYPLAL
jgi:hypothetical protein